jgi:hypothetical protein
VPPAGCRGNLPESSEGVAEAKNGAQKRQSGCRIVCSSFREGRSPQNRSVPVGEVGERCFDFRLSLQYTMSIQSTGRGCERTLVENREENEPCLKTFIANWPNG